MPPKTLPGRDVGVIKFLDQVVDEHLDKIPLVSTHVQSQVTKYRLVGRISRHVRRRTIKTHPEIPWKALDATSEPASRLSRTLRYTNMRGSEAVTSCASTTSGRCTSCLSSATDSLLLSLRAFRDNRCPPSSPSSSESESSPPPEDFLVFALLAAAAAAAAAAASASAHAASSIGPFASSATLLNRSKICLKASSDASSISAPSRT